jgi:hypothetical protein
LVENVRNGGSGNVGYRSDLFYISHEISSPCNPVSIPTTHLRQAKDPPGGWHIRFGKR